MVDIPLTWQLQIQGAENVKSKLSDLNGQFERGEITTEQYATGLRSVNRDARVMSNTMNIQKNIFLATHPVLNNLTRAMNIFGSVNRAVMSGLNTINIAMIALNTNSAGVAQAQADLAQKQREYDEAVLKFGPDSKQAIQALDELRVAQAKLGEETQNRSNQITSAWLSVGAAISGVVTSIVLTLPKILPFIGGLGTAFGSLIAFFEFLPTGMTNFALFASTFLDLIPGMIEAQTKFGDAMRYFFRVLLPITATIGLQIVTNLMNGIGKALVDGINMVVKGIVNAINTLIRIYNAAASRLKLGTIPTINFTPIAFTPIGGTALTNPSGISPETNPGLFPRTSGGGGGNTINITVQGSILTENDIKKVFDKWLKNDLQTVGFG